MECEYRSVPLEDQVALLRDEVEALKEQVKDLTKNGVKRK